MNQTAAATLPASSVPHASVADAVERVAASTVGVGTRRHGLAAGVVWRSGVVLTAASAIGHNEKVQVVLPDGETVTGDVRGSDPGTDLALIALDTGTIPPPALRLDPSLRVGDFVFAVGRDPSGQVHASFGYIGATGGPWRSWRGGQVERLLRLDGGLSARLVGAPVADAHGQVAGIGTAALSRHYGVVLPASTLDRVSSQLLAHGRVLRGHIGIAAQPVALSSAMQTAASTGAATALLVAGIGEDSPAARSGLLVGDIIVSAGGHELHDIETLREQLAAERIGTRLQLRLLRGGQSMELGVEVAEHRPAVRC
jgi:S1-C subfamily serine protease